MFVLKVKKVKQMKLWVYIYEDEKGCLKIALSTPVGNIKLNRQSNMSIVYLRPFEIPFDAIAHKHLLDNLSKESVLDWIYKHKEKTEVWLNVSNRD